MSIWKSWSQLVENVLYVFWYGSESGSTKSILMRIRIPNSIFDEPGCAPVWMECSILANNIQVCQVVQSL